MTQFGYASYGTETGVDYETGLVPKEVPITSSLQVTTSHLTIATTQLILVVIYRKTSSTPYTFLEAINWFSYPSYTDMTAEPGTTYTYKTYRGFNLTPISAWSPPFTITYDPILIKSSSHTTTFADNTYIRHRIQIESPVTIHTPTYLTETINIADMPVHIYRSDSGAPFELLSPGALPVWNDPHYMDANINRGGHYDYKIRRENAGAYTEYSKTITISYEPTPIAANVHVQTAASTYTRLATQIESRPIITTGYILNDIRTPIDQKIVLLRSTNHTNYDPITDPQEVSWTSPNHLDNTVTKGQIYSYKAYRDTAGHLTPLSPPLVIAFDPVTIQIVSHTSTTCVGVCKRVVIINSGPIHTQVSIYSNLDYISYKRSAGTHISNNGLTLY